MKVLIIEDEAVGQAWKGIAEGLGAEAILATTPEEAWDMVSTQVWTNVDENNPVLVIIDVEAGNREFNFPRLLSVIPKHSAIETVASSGKSHLRAEQMQYGCTRDSGGKPNVTAIIIEFAATRLAQAA